MPDVSVLAADRGWRLGGLKALTQAGLLTVTQEGRFQRYRANIALMLELIAYLSAECCAGQPEQCASLRAASPCPEALLPPLAGAHPTCSDPACEP